VVLGIEEWGWGGRFGVKEVFCGDLEMRVLGFAETEEDLEARKVWDELSEFLVGEAVCGLFQRSGVCDH
jgi:hypothetical protein